MRLRAQLIIYLTVCSLWVGMASAQSPRQVNIPVADEIEGVPVLLVHHSGTRIDMMRDREVLGRIGRRVILAAWEDGTLVWSKNPIRGGEPYFTAQVEREHLTRIIAAMCETAMTLPEEQNTDSFGPDSAHNIITVRGDACAFNWRTWHEVYEAQGRLVSVDGALTVLPAGQRVDEYRRERSSAEYNAFIDAWHQAKETALSIIPESSAGGTPVAVTFRTNWVQDDATPKEEAPTSTDRELLAAEAVERLTGQSVNIYTSEWSDLPEPEFINHLMTAINEGRFAEHDWLASRAREMALRRLQQYPEIVYPLLVEALEDPESPHVLGRTALSLPPSYQATAYADIRALIERDAFSAQKEEFLHSGLFGRTDRHEPFWLDLAVERYRNESAPLNARIAAGATLYSTMEPGEVLADVQNADEASREAALGALSRLLAYYMTNVALETEVHLQAARPLIVEGLQSNERDVRRWAAWAIGHVALEFGDHVPHRDKPSADPAMMEAIREALKAEKDWEIHGNLERGLREMKVMFGVE